MEYDGVMPTKSNLSNYIIQEHIMRYVFASEYTKDKIVLDAACGCGYGSHFLAISGARKVIAVDIDRKALKLAKNHFSHPKVTYLQGDVTSLPFPDSYFEVITSFETIEHLSNPADYIQEIQRILKDDGIFICSTPNTKYTRHPAYHLHEFSPDEFFNLLDKNFREVEKYGQYISRFQRLNDLIRQKIIGLASAVLLILLKNKNIESKISKIIYSRPSQDPSQRPQKIDEIDVSTMGKNKVTPLENKRILRIMVGVCKK